MIPRSRKESRLQSMLTLNNISKSYKLGKEEVPILKHINLTVQAGEFLAIMGPSGSGKSTLMNIIGCLDRPTSGTYTLDQIDILKGKDGALAEIRNESIGFVFQTFHLLPRLTALQNVELPMIYNKVKKKERRQRAYEALEKVGLKDRVSYKPPKLSGGQKQRVAIARALVNQPRFILADEPTGALDTKSSEQILALFSELHREGKTIIMITHDPDVAKKADRTVFIRDGELVLDERGDISHA
ncbi:Putative ABC transporter (ATP-binding protein) [Bacillus subtilis QB928]|nr:Putative ABC transporter (ATP-binding protein) [Bacillus subtilis QB928]